MECGPGDPVTPSTERERLLAMLIKTPIDGRLPLVCDNFHYFLGSLLSLQLFKL